ncbi:MAG: hypothetical protein DRN99_02790 [Thermoproteota archaeon]|nr:MAG: hypothetical protein DRN99_02790 [Candidatus Korarchaeota archaeon]
MLALTLGLIKPAPFSSAISLLTSLLLKPSLTASSATSEAETTGPLFKRPSKSSGTRLAFSSPILLITDSTASLQLLPARSSLATGGTCHLLLSDTTKLLHSRVPSMLSSGSRMLSSMPSSKASSSSSPP